MRRSAPVIATLLLSGSAHAASIHGVVTNSATSAPIQNATVILINAANPTPQFVFTGADGAYLFDALAYSAYSVQTFATGYYSQDATVYVIPFIAENPTRNFPLEARASGTSTVQGKVINGTTGQSITGAIVDAYWSGHPEDSTGTTITIPAITSWTYRFTNLPAGTYTLHASANGFVAGELANVAVAEGATTSGADIILFPGTASVSGTVRARGTNAPLETAVIALVDTNLRPVGSASSAVDGTFTIDGLGAGTYTGSALKNGYQTGFTIVLNLGGTEDRTGVNFTLEDTNPPGAPAALTATRIDAGVDLEWTASLDESALLGSGDVLEYRLLRSTAEAGPFTQVATATATGAPTYSLNDAAVPGSGSLYYVARSWDGTYESGDSPVAAIVEDEDSWAVY